MFGEVFSVILVVGQVLLIEFYMAGRVEANQP